MTENNTAALRQVQTERSGALNNCELARCPENFSKQSLRIDFVIFIKAKTPSNSRQKHSN